MLIYNLNEVRRNHKKYQYTRVVGIIAGSITIIGAIGFGLFVTLANGISKVWDNGQQTYNLDPTFLVITLLILLLGLVTIIGTLVLNHKHLRMLYTWYSLVIGIGFTGLFFVSAGAIGTRSEMLLLFIGSLYISLCLLSIKKY